MAKNGNFYKTLRSIFGIGFIKSKGYAGKDMPHPAYTDPKTGKSKLIKFPTEIQQLYDQWISNTFDSTETLKNRIERYKDLDYMYYNNTIMSMATELYADETVQADAQSQVLQITAKDRATEKYIIDFFDNIGVTQKVLRSTAFDIALYGDHFWILPSNAEEGITEVVPVDVYSCNDRIEFNALEVKKEMRRRNQTYINLISRDSRLIKLADMLQETADGEDKSRYFANYLFGFQFEEEIFLPPWNVAHFRRFTTKSEFYPFGRPIFINCISPFRQLQASKNLMALARAYKFPKEHFEVETDESMTQTEKWERVNEAREEYQNLSVNETGKDHFAIGGQIWSPRNLLSYNLIENRMSLDDIADIEMLRDDLIMGTRIPKGYLIVDRASFGTSGQALLQQFKPFGRTVFTIQSAILEELVNIVRLHFAMTGDYDYDTEFEITLPFPVIEESSDRLRMKSDTLRLANDIITNLQSALGLGRDEAMPPDVVKDIFSKMSFMDDEDLTDWINGIMADKENGEEETGGKKSMWSGMREKIKGRISDELLRETYFKSKKKLNMREGVSQNRHFVSSFSMDRTQKLVLAMILDGKSDNPDGKIEG